MNPLAISTEFEGLIVVKNVCRNYAVCEAFKFKTVHANHGHYKIRCEANKCPWYIYATSV